MDKQEFGRIAGAIKGSYPNSKVCADDFTMELWFHALMDIDYKVLLLAVEQWISTNKWPPTIADLREACLNITLGPLPDWGKAWQQVVKAIGSYGHTQPQKAFDSMDYLTRAAVERVGWKDLCLSENLVSSRANFRDIFNQIAMQARQREQLPPRVRNMIEENTIKRLEKNT